MISCHNFWNHWKCVLQTSWYHMISWLEARIFPYHIKSDVINANPVEFFFIFRTDMIFLCHLVIEILISFSFLDTFLQYFSLSYTVLYLICFFLRLHEYKIKFGVWIFFVKTIQLDFSGAKINPISEFHFIKVIGYNLELIFYRFFIFTFTKKSK